MPVPDYGNLLAPMGMYRAQLAMRSVMAWPDPANEAARQEYVATLMSMRLADLKAKRHTLPDPRAAQGWEETILAVESHEALTHAQELFEAWFDAVGGHASVSMAPGFRAFQSDFRARLGGWFAAGLILALVRRMAEHHGDLRGGASVNKAVFILENAKQPYVTSKRSELYNAWKTYKSVAHFGAALYDWFLIACEHNETPEEVAVAFQGELDGNFPMFLSEAEAYLEFGLAYQPPRNKAQTLLDPAETWALPQQRLWPDSPYKPAPLSGPQLQAALEYCAPVVGA